MRMSDAPGSHRDKIVDEVVGKVTQRAGTDAEPDTVRPKAEQAVDRIIDEPVQTFTPLLAENQVVSELIDERDAGR
jgi:hypothetical protein